MFDSQIDYPKGAYELLSERFSEKRRERMLSVASKRTRHVKLVIQDVHQPHNISACMRSADAFGVLEVDVVTLNQPFKPTTPAKGVIGWLDIDKKKSVEETVLDLRKKGYKIAAGFPAQDSDYKLETLPIDEPIAVIFGNEHAGVDADFTPHIDYKFTIPMVGMVESLNISVSAALTLRELTHRASQSLPRETYYLSDEQKQALLDKWTCRQVDKYKEEIDRLKK